MGLHFENLLHAAEVVNPVDEVEWRKPEVNRRYRTALGIKLCILSYLSIPLRSPDARCFPSGLIQMVRMPVLMSAVCPSPGLSALHS